MEIYTSKLITEIMENIDPIFQRKIEIKMVIASKISDIIENKEITKKELKLKFPKYNINEILAGNFNFDLDFLIELEKILKIKIINL